MISKRTRINEDITAREVRLIGADNEQVGVVSISEALTRAKEAELDLIEVAPQAQPPVVKIVDWGKYQYEQTKIQNAAKKKNKQQEVKQIRFGLKIGQHDKEVKLRKILSFLEKGHMVKLTVFFRGREIVHPELGHQLLAKLVEDLGETVVVETEPQLSGKQLSMVVRRRK